MELMRFMNDYTDAQKNTMLRIAAQSIQHGLEHGTPLEIFSFEFESKLQELRATFVTLEINAQLRGCIGMLKAIKPVIEDVANNAYSAAFKDPRFQPLKPNEFENLDIHISILTPAEDFPVKDEADLLQQLRPDIDGLILQEGPYQSTFLPSVWESLPAPQDFLRHLKHKAGLSGDHWSDTIRFKRYQTLSFGSPVSDLVLEKAL